MTFYETINMPCRLEVVLKSQIPITNSGILSWRYLMGF